MPIGILLWVLSSYGGWGRYGRMPVLLQDPTQGRCATSGNIMPSHCCNEAMHAPKEVAQSGSIMPNHCCNEDMHAPKGFRKAGPLCETHCKP